MKCLKCNSENLVTKIIRHSPEIKGEVVEVLAPCLICNNCHETSMDIKQMNVMRGLVADEYRRKHHLLTSKEIVALRNSFGMSQIAFANYLKVGEASIKRWETCFIQDESQDELIRIKCRQADAERNALEVNWKNKPPDIYSGYRKFNFELFKNAVLYLVDVAKVSILFLNKALFYLDFVHYKRHKTSITGTRHVPLQYGPCPDQFQLIFQYLVDTQQLEPRSNRKDYFKAKVKADLSLFDEQELETLKFIANMCKEQKKLQTLFDISHQERGFLETPKFQPISYDYAKYLKIA